MSFVAERLKPVKPSPTLSLSAKAAEMKAAGKNVISLGAGEPDFDTPSWVCEAAIEAIRKGETRYTNVTGTPALRKAVQEKFRRENALEYTLQEILVGVGAKQVIFNAFLATINPGDEVIMPAPYWVSYADMVMIAGGKPVIVECHDDVNFRLSPERLRKAITPRTRWLVLNSPSNPTGIAYSEDELRDLGNTLLEFPAVQILSDDIYEHILYTGQAYSTIASAVPALKERTLTVNGVSKSHGMTGWRIGFAGGPKQLIDAMAVIQSQSTSNPCSIAQAAALAALTGPQEFRQERMEIFRIRRDYVVAALNDIPGLSCTLPEGAFYAYPSCRGLIGKRTPSGETIRTDSDLAAWFLNEWGVAIVPGEAFGLSPYLRISFATGMPVLEAAMARIRQAVDQLV